MRGSWESFEVAGERVSICMIPPGLPLVVIEKKGFLKKFAAFGVRYGSFDRVFIPPGEDRQVVLPDGTAHFLEHCAFEGREGNALAIFSNRGAMVNAGTSHVFTFYYFSCTERFEENFRDLLYFVRKPEITEKSVEKERGIIEQEIRMYEDMPEDAKWRLLFRGLFRFHPIRNHVAGTVQSIKAIDAEVLKTCFNSFYRPENMLLCVVADEDRQSVLEKASSALQSLSEWCRLRGKPKRIYLEEPAEVAEAVLTRTMAVGLPKVVLGFKEVSRDRSSEALLKREIASDFLVEAVFGSASKNFRILYEEGLVDENFFAVAGVYPEIGFVAFGGDTPKPATLLSRLREMAERSVEELKEEDFERVKRKFIGEFIKRFNTVELLGSACFSFMVHDLTLKDIWEALNETDFPSVKSRAEELFSKGAYAQAVIYPMQWQGEKVSA